MSEAIIRSGDLKGVVQTKLAKASEAIKAGMFLETNGGEWAKHSTAGANSFTEVVIALSESHLDPDTAFDDGESVRGMHVSPRHNEVSAILLSGENVTIDTLLESDGTGKLRARTFGRALAKASEAVDASAADKRIKVLVLGDSTQGGTLKMALISGSTAGNHTLTGIAVGDRIVSVGHFSTEAAIATLADLTSEFSVDSANTIDNTGGTDTTNDQLQVFWEDLT
ncbi:hypothetical protein LCGC14_2268530 [marine sediment metagenome]|uniref:Uncharacterized protein n=1 Tax=marine sediment metagenome TaxID=412755 RepID=A0A0F9FSP3_9ZZZZ